MIKEKRFILAWGAFFVSLLVVATFVLWVICYFVTKFNLFTKPELVYWLLLAVPFVVWYLRLTNRLEVSPELNVIGEWQKRKMEPFKPGWHFPFRYFGFFEEIAEVPMNKQTLFILSGQRDGIEQAVVDQYVYGTASNMEPGTGDFIRLLYRVEIKCIDSLAATYNVDDPYEYIAGVIELNVGLYVHKSDGEEIIDKFTKETLDSIININIQEQILTDTGIKLISFIPVDVINTPEVEAIRRELDHEERQTAINKAKIKNAVQIKEGDGELLKVTLANKAIEEDISKKDDQIRTNEIKSIKDATGVSGDEALKFIIKDKTLETIAAASQTGNITYIDDSNNGNLNPAAAMGFAINATNQKKS